MTPGAVEAARRLTPPGPQASGSEAARRRVLAPGGIAEVLSGGGGAAGGRDRAATSPADRGGLAAAQTAITPIGAVVESGATRGDLRASAGTGNFREGTDTFRPPGPGGVRSRPLRFAALGDSLTAGVGDPVDGGWRGWAALLGDGRVPTAQTPAAGGEPAVVFRNFAISGALTRDVEELQTPAVLRFGADIASVVVGVNDTLRRSFDIQDLALRLNRVCGQLAAQGSLLLTACLPDPGTMLGLPAPLARPLARRQRAVNAVVHALAARYGSVHLHMSDTAWVADRSLWSADRLHPGELGHRTIALRFHEMLTDRGFAVGPAPSLMSDQRAPSGAASLLWLATAGTGWVARRCHDLLPELLQLAGAEIRHWARGTSTRLDAHAELALSRALATLSPASPFAGAGE